MPWAAIEKDYRFETEQGTRSLAELFDGRSQLLVYHFMFGPGYTAGCPVCRERNHAPAGLNPTSHLSTRTLTRFAARK